MARYDAVHSRADDLILGDIQSHAVTLSACTLYLFCNINQGIYVSRRQYDSGTCCAEIQGNLLPNTLLAPVTSATCPINRFSISLTSSDRQSNVLPHTQYSSKGSYPLQRVVIFWFFRTHYSPFSSKLLPESKCLTAELRQTHPGTKPSWHLPT